MIETIADFLQEFKNTSIERIKREHSDITHRPTIGNIYGGLTNELLSKSVFAGLDLRIVQNSFIYNESGVISPEMDCLIVTGNGVKIDFTNQYKYHIKNVIAVFQVKKKLYKADLDSSYQNLKSVINISEPREPEEYIGRLHIGAYEGMTGKPYPTRERKDRFTERDHSIYYCLLMEAFYPLRIVIAYSGYKDEYAFREGFLDLLQEVTKERPAKGYSPFSLPNLMICGNSSIVKMNGMPYAAKFSDQDFYWHLLASSHKNPFYYLLQILWTRLSYMFKLPLDIFGDDSHLDAFHPFLFCKDSRVSDVYGWEYKSVYLSKDRLAQPLKDKEFVPAEIDETQGATLLLLVNKGEVEVNGKDFVQILKRHNLNSDLYKEFN